MTNDFNNNMPLTPNVINDNEFIREAVYDKCRRLFEKEIEDTILNQKKMSIGDIGYITSEIKHQGTKSGEVIKNVKVKFVPSKKFRKEINKSILGK